MTHWIRRYPALADAALAAAVLAVSVPPVSTIAGRNRALSLILVIALICPLAWRRRAPLLVFLVIAGVAVVQCFTTRELTDDLALLAAFYTLAAHQPRGRVLAAAAILAAGAALAVHSLQGWAIASGVVAGAGFLGYHARTRAERMERERDQQVQLAAAAERTRISRELHDIVAHNIAVMIALAEGAAYTVTASPDQAVSLMGQVSATGRSALTEMRRLLGVLREPSRPRHAPQPTLDQVADLLASVRTAGLPARLSVTGQPFPLPASAQLAIYRLIQEALTNALKHAPGATAEIRLTYLPGQVELEVTDDGGSRGVVPPAGRPASGHGIAGMRERAGVFGGQVSAGPAAHGGWRVHTVLRLRPPAEDT